MEDITKEVFKALSTFVNEEKRLLLPRFFKTGKGEYGEGDKFIGVVVPDIRTVAKQFADLSMADIDRLLAGEWHEMRTCALFIWHIPRASTTGILSTSRLRRWWAAT